MLAYDALTSDDALMLFGERIDMEVERIGGKLIVSPPIGFASGVRKADLMLSSSYLGTGARVRRYEPECQLPVARRRRSRAERRTRAA